ncbi:MAG TPA: RNase adapter RapZ [Ignavibacteria bacterium]|nr:RNase adapter RapZ [Ignavibacteria bacterium]
MLKVRIFSFSYKYNGIPQDTTENGGGFVFDCRFIHNPGKYEEYKNLTGKDEKVIIFLQKQAEMTDFLINLYGIIDKSVDNYIKREFSDLMISFGCTGGRHRSVYSAEKLSVHLKEKYPEIEIVVTHQNIE